VLIRDGRPSNPATTWLRLMCGGQVNVGFSPRPLWRATSIWIAMSFFPMAATVRCGRHPTQSRQRVVEATLNTWTQREAGTPGQA
jgi:hypothetical protein